jgi:hypothetical protein
MIGCDDISFDPFRGGFVHGPGAGTNAPGYFMNPLRGLQVPASESEPERKLKLPRGIHVIRDQAEARHRRGIGRGIPKDSRIAQLHEVCDVIGSELELKIFVLADLDVLEERGVQIPSTIRS